MSDKKQLQKIRLTLAQILGDVIVEKLQQKRQSQVRLTLSEILNSEQKIRKQIR